MKKMIQKLRQSLHVILYTINWKTAFLSALGAAIIITASGIIIDYYFLLPKEAEEAIRYSRVFPYSFIGGVIGSIIAQVQIKIQNKK